MGKENRTCPYCNACFSQSAFFQHMRDAHADSHPVKCHYCGYQARTTVQMQQHVRVKHEEHHTKSDVTEKSVACPHCMKELKSKRYLQRHLKLHESQRFKCGYCTFTSVQQPLVRYHLKKRHATMPVRMDSVELVNNPLVITENLQQEEETSEAENQRLWTRKYSCSKCNYTCNYASSFNRHMKNHTGTIRYKCNYCEFLGREKYYVRRHIDRIHPDLPMVILNHADCKVANTCGKFPRQKRHLPSAARTEEVESVPSVTTALVPVVEEPPAEPPVREVVTKKFPKKTMFWSNSQISDFVSKRTATSITCTCGVTTVTKAFYKHVKTHSKVKPFQCGYCEYSSIERAKIRVHNAFVHPNLQVCIKELPPPSVVAEKTANPHRQTNIMLPCPICTKSLTYHTSLIRRHFYFHYNYRPFRCGHCNYAGLTIGEVKQHAVSHGENHKPLIEKSHQKIPEDLEDTLLKFLSDIKCIARTSRYFPEKESRAMNTLEGQKWKESLLRGICPWCNEQMRQFRPNVTKHFKTHFNYKPFRCSYCNHECLEKADILQHLSRKHSGEQQKFHKEERRNSIVECLRKNADKLKETPSDDAIQGIRFDGDNIVILPELVSDVLTLLDTSYNNDRSPAQVERNETLGLGDSRGLDQGLLQIAAEELMNFEAEWSCQ